MANYTLMSGLGVTNLATTFTHSLSHTPANLVARILSKNAVVTATAPLMICTIGTNIITVASGVGTLQTFDLEIQKVHSIIK